MFGPFRYLLLSVEAVLRERQIGVFEESFQGL